MGKFGWSYPAGCDGPPEPIEQPCDVCGNYVHNCICPECPVCGIQGDPACYKDHGLKTEHSDNERSASLPNPGHTT